MTGPTWQVSPRGTLIAYRSVARHTARSERESMNRLAIILGIIVLVVAFAAAPMSLTETLQNPTRSVVIYPNTLFAVPLILLGALLLLYGLVWKKNHSVK
jgi:uncharacterized RDD family membrane protein YckC